MFISNPPQIAQHNEQRQAADHAVGDLYKTLSSPYCRSCLERISDGVLLLDSETQVIYATPRVLQVLSKQEQVFTLTPMFTLHAAEHAARFSAFVNGKNNGVGPLSLLLETDGGNNPLLITCFQLPKPAEPNVHAVRYMLTLRDFDHYPTQQWRLFNEQFQLTPAEARLCRTLADGLTLNDYCKKWNIAASTARSQLSSVFGKTSTRRQADLLRLIFLFSRT